MTRMRCLTGTPILVLSDSAGYRERQPREASFYNIKSYGRRRMSPVRRCACHPLFRYPAHPVCFDHPLPSCNILVGFVLILS